MKTNWKRLVGLIGLSALLAGPAGAELVAGWDFSDLSGDSAAVPPSYAANYTSGSAATSGTLSATGLVASAMEPGTNTGDADGIQGGITGAGSPTSTDPVFPAGTTSFVGGQALGLTARGAGQAEFTANGALPSASWRLTFGGRAIVNGANPGSGRTTVGVTFGPSCPGSLVREVELDPTDTGFEVWLGQLGGTSGCVGLTVDGSTVQPLIDNVAISTVPEPGFGALVASGIAGLALLGRRRQG